MRIEALLQDGTNVGELEAGQGENPPVVGHDISFSGEKPSPEGADIIEYYDDSKVYRVLSVKVESTPSAIPPLTARVIVEEI